MSKTVALRTALIWHDEVMADVVLEKPTKVTLGATGTPTFIVPDLGLPKGFAIVRPGNRGYLLTLGERMRGTICVDGEQKPVEDFVRRGGEGDGLGGFRATPISGRDWGVIELDESGDYKLFFQFVPVEDAQPFFTSQVVRFGILGYFIVNAVLTAIFKTRGITTDWTLGDSSTYAEYAEALFRSFVLATASLGLGGVLWWMFRQDFEQKAAMMFSIVLHAALIFMTYQLYDASDPFVWPGPRALTGNYLATRLEKEPEPPKPVPTVGQKVDTGMAAPKTPDPPKHTATKGDQGAAGGKGDKERMRDKNATDEPVSVPKVGLFEDKNRKVLDSIDQNLVTKLDKFNGIKGDETRPGSFGFGHGTGTGVGDFANGTGTTKGSKGHGPGGGGNVEGDFVSGPGKVDTGTQRPGGGNCAKPPCGNAPKEVHVAVGEAEGDLEGLTAEEINRVVKARQGVFKACYQRELNRQPGLGGKLVMHFVIGGDGVVKSAKVGGGSSMRNDSVEECMNSNIMRLRFPAKGGISNVNYPFVFQPGG